MQISQLEEQFAPPGLRRYLDEGAEGLAANATSSLFTTFTANIELLLPIQQQGGFCSSASAKLNSNLEIFNRTTTRGEALA